MVFVYSDYSRFFSGGNVYGFSLVFWDGDLGFLGVRMNREVVFIFWYILVRVCIIREGGCGWSMYLGI